MTREESLAYSRGYNAGRSRRWPAHKPPLPPDELCAEMARALYALRDSVDSWLAQFGVEDDDPMHADVIAKIYAADEVMAKVGKWLTTNGELP